MKKKIFVIDHGTYPFDILVAIGASHQEILDWLWEKRKFKPDEEEKEKLYMSGIGRTVMLRNGATILRLDNVKKKTDFHANLAHEVFHATEFLFNKIGIKHDSEISSEAFAYQIGYITGSIYEMISKKLLVIKG